MSKSKLVITHPIHEAGIRLLKDYFEIEQHSEKLLNEEALMQLVTGAEGLITWLTDPVTDRVLEAAGSQLKIIAQYAVGFDNIDLEAAAKRNILVTNTPGVISGPAVAEHAFTLMFAVARHTVPADHFLRTGMYKHWDPEIFVGQQLTGKNVGIIGTGQIGSIFAKMCHNGLGMRVLYTDLKRNEAIERDLGAIKVTQERLLKEADVVSLHVPLLPSTKHLIDGEALKRMKKSAILVNTSRGPIVKEEALIKALQEKEIFGAGLDVYEHEPQVSPELIALENAVLMPHIGSATETARIGMAECVARNIRVAFSGEQPPNLIKK